MSNDRFLEWLKKYLEVQETSDYKNHTQVARAIEYVIYKYQEMQKKEKGEK